MTPVEPPKKAIGRNTADSTSAIAISAICSSPIDLIVASRGRHARIFFHQPLDVLDHHDRVVDQQADRQHQPEQGQRVDREAGDVEHRERAEQHDRDGDRRDQQRAPVLQEDEHHDDDEDDRLDQRLHDLLDRQLDEVGGVVGVGELRALRENSPQAARTRALTRSAVSSASRPEQARLHARAGMAVHADDRR